MGKKINVQQRRLVSRECRQTPYQLRSCHQEILEEKVEESKKCLEYSEKEDWHNATCSVCMEQPHNAILLVCSSHKMGCRPYMCATGSRYSNCFDKYKKGCAKLTDLSCPHCRGQVRSWTVIEPARQFLNAKKRSCVQEGCSFEGNYKELRQHTRAVHPSIGPGIVDPNHEERWRKMECERECDDVICMIRSSMPGTLIIGDYVVDASFSVFLQQGSPLGWE